jgi:hypothetical protein
MPYPSSQLLSRAADGLRGAHNFVVISVPAILRAAKASEVIPTELVRFGSALERALLARAFELGDTRKPYLSVWSNPPAWLEADIARRGFQAQRTRDAFAQDVFIDNFGVHGPRRTEFALKPTAGQALQRKSRQVAKIDLAIWLSRSASHERIDDVAEWFDTEFPMGGTDLDKIYLDEIPDEYRDPGMWSDIPPTNDEVLLALGVEAPSNTSAQSEGSSDSHRQTDKELLETGFEWTRALVSVPLREPIVEAISKRAMEFLIEREIALPDVDRLVKRCVVALLSGHLVLQGPPGTGKTTLARALAHAFRVDLSEATATSEWTPYNVVGGYRVGADGLHPHYGAVTRAVVQCAEHVRADEILSSGEPASLLDLAPTVQAVWLLIDEFNRADIDKSIGSLYTLLGSCDPDNLATSPIDLWFESVESRQKLWMPGRFRIIGCMNDVDTSFVNRISQGLTRRFNFVTVGVPNESPTAEKPVTIEVETAFRQASDWLRRVYGSVLDIPETRDLEVQLQNQLESISTLVHSLRYPGTVKGWPIGTAQVVDVLRSLLLEHPTDNAQDVLDRAIADRLVPQMGMIDDDQYNEFRRRFDEYELHLSAGELRRLIDPSSLE